MSETRTSLISAASHASLGAEVRIPASRHTAHTAFSRVESWSLEPDGYQVPARADKKTDGPGMTFVFNKGGVDTTKLMNVVNLPMQSSAVVRKMTQAAAAKPTDQVIRRQPPC